MDKKALITGASSGIGRDIARELSNRGYELVLVGRNLERLEKLKEKLNVNCKIIACDLSIVENCKKVFEENKDIDILINNAGLGLFGKFDETDLDTELNIINTNIVAMHILAKLYLKEMIKKNDGRILNVSSIAAFLPGPLMATYYSTKAYVVRLTESMNAELKKEKSKVKVSVLCPGPVDTNFNNTAGVKFNLHSLTSEYVARYTVDKLLKNKFMIIPGIFVKFAIFGARFTPLELLYKLVYRSQTKKMKNKGL